MQPKDILTPLQAKFLEAFFRKSESQSFFLTGGTALSAYYLYHRYSEDLDLFTLDKEALHPISLAVKEIADELKLKLTVVRTLETLHQYTLEEAGKPEILKIDCVREIPVQFGEIGKQGVVRVDSLENIAVNKATTILSRTEIKDFVDLYFILQKGFVLEKLIEKGKQKDLGLTEFYFAGQLLNVKNFHQLPRMILPLELSALQKFFIEVADRLFDKIKP